MREWKACSLGDVVDIGSSKRIFYEDYVAEGVPFYRSKEVIERAKGNSVSTELFITEKKFEEISKRWGAPEQGDLLLTSVGTLGVPYLVGKGERFYFKDGNLTWFRSFKKELSNRFLLYWFVSPIGRSELDMASIGSTQAALTIQGLKKLELRLPEPAEQESITAVLSSLDAKIDLLHRQNKTLEALAETLFRQWFVELNGPSDAGGDWESTVLGKAVSVLEAGRRPPGGVSAYTSGVPSIGAESIVGLGHFDYNKTKYVPREYYDRMQRGIVKDMDVLLYKDGGRPGEFEPHVTMVGHGFPFTECCINEHVFRIRTDGVLPQSFLYFWLSSDAIMDEMRNSGTGAAIPGLNASAVRDLTLEVPPQTLMKQFADLADPMVTRILANCKEARTLSKLRDTLLPKLMSGEVRVEMPLSAIVV